MSIKTRLAALEKIVKEKVRNKATGGPLPPVRVAYVCQNGAFDLDGYRAAAERWSKEVLGKPLELVAEEIADAEGF